MRANARCLFRPAASVLVFSIAAAVLLAEPPTAADKDADPAVADKQSVERVSVGEARNQAKLLYKTYLAILREVHRRYYEEDEGQIIPARTLEDVFKEVDEGSSRETRWIAVNSEAMNVDHIPRAGFETRAADALSNGAEEYEAIEDGVYYRAGSVPLKGGCLHCHVSALTRGVTKQRIAGFVVSMPVENE